MPYHTEDNSIIITVPHACCLNETDKHCNRKAKSHALDLFDFFRNNRPVDVKETRFYVHKKSGDIHLLISRTHKLDCNLNSAKCAARKPAFLKKLQEIIDFTRESKTIVLDVHSFPKNHGYDRNLDNQMVILYPQGHRKQACFFKEILKDYNNYNVAILKASENNYIVSKYSSNSPMSLILEYPDQ